MGLFDFAANIGKKVFGVGEVDAATEIKEFIEKSNPGVADLKVGYDPKSELVVLDGECDTCAAKEKVVLMVGNMEGVTHVAANGLIAPEPEGEVEYYVIEKGDTLWAIASKLLGDGNKYPEIFEANREVIEDPDLIFPGQKIRIPK